MSLRWRLALALAALAAVATLTAGTVSYRATRDRLYHEIDNSLTTAMATLADRGPGPDGPPERGPFNQYVLAQWDGNGEILAGAQDVALDAGERSVLGRSGRSITENRAVGGVEFRFRTVGTPDGALRLGRNLSETNRVLSALRLRIVVIVAAITAAAAVVGALVAGTLTRPLRRLTGAADVVSTTGRLDVRVDAAGADEVARLARSFDRMLDALARSRDDQQRLVQDAGHELRTPLTSLRTNLDVLHRHPHLDPAERAEVVADIQAETDELVALVNELVTVASGATDDEPLEEIDLGAMARRLAERYSRRSDRHVVVDADDSAVRAPPQGLHRAISNLLDNARKFDSSSAPIELTVRRGELIVADHGPGIAPEDLERIFDRFHRATTARTLPGSGLGLSIVADVVRRSGGTVLARNRDDGGAEVGFRLPPAG